MRSNYLLLLLLGGCLYLTGCAGTMGIYETDYGCPKGDQGQCLPVDEAHRVAVEETFALKGQGTAREKVISDFRPDPVEEQEFLIKEVGDFKGVLLAYDKCVKSKSAADCEKERVKLLEQYRSAEDRGRAKELHGVSMQERVAKLAVMEAVVSGGSNTVPVRQPDTIMELHIMPYRTNFGALASERVIWVVVQEGEWTWATSEGQPGARTKLGATQ